MVAAYHHSAATLNLVRAFTQGGYAALQQVHAWNQDFVRDSPAGQRYERLAGEIDRAMAFMHACGADPEEFQRVDLYAGHEALVLDYEQALTRIDSRTGLPYDVSGHFVWIGDRTRALDGAHVDFAARIRNPIGLKIGPVRLPGGGARARPPARPGPRAGPAHADRPHGRRPGARAAAADRGEGERDPAPRWCGSATRCTATPARRRPGCKTRLFEDVVEEVRGFFEVHRSLGTVPGGIHVELTGDDVTECLGGALGTEEHHLEPRYETACDPRLNREQSIELAFLVAEMLAH